MDRRLRSWKTRRFRLQTQALLLLLAAHALVCLGGEPWSEHAVIPLDDVKGSYLKWIYDEKLHVSDGVFKEFDEWREGTQRYWRPSEALTRPYAPSSDFLNDDPLDDWIFIQSQGARLAMRYAGLKLFKTCWDFAILPQLLQDVLPRTVVEVGSGTGASALWLADSLALARRYASADGDFAVHSFDVEGPPPGVDHPHVRFHLGNSSEPERTWPAEFLAALPHPWVVIDDAHVNVEGLAAHFLSHMVDGDYLYIEDCWNARKRRTWLRFLLEHEDALVVDALYTDFFGVNVLSAADGVVRVSRRAASGSASRDEAGPREL